MRREYRITMKDGQSFLLSADMAESTAGMQVNWSGEDDGWDVPYQTANVSHRIDRAAHICAVYAAEPGDCTEVDTVEVLG